MNFIARQSKTVTCPACAAELEPDSAEWKTGETLCPECNTRFGFAPPATSFDAEISSEQGSTALTGLPVPGEKVLYTKKAITGGTLLGGPLAATFLIAHNFRALGKKDEAGLTWIVGIAATVIIIPVLMAIPGRILPEPILRGLHLLWLIPAHIVFRKFQQAEVESSLSSGGQKGSAWKAGGIGVLALLIFLAYAFCIAVLTTKKTPEIPSSGQSFVTMEYSGCKVYYDSSAVSQSDARVAGAVLEKVGYFNDQMKDLEALIYRQDGQYVIAFGVDQDALSDRQVEKTLKEALKELQSAYGNRHYQFRLLGIDSAGIQDEKYIKSD